MTLILSNGRLSVRLWPVCAALATLLAVSMALGQEAPKTADAYLWTFQYKKSETTHLKTHINIVSRDPTSSKEYHVAMDKVIRRNVQTVNAKGDAALLETTEKSDTTFEGKTVENPQAQPVILEVYSKNGLIVKEAAHESGTPSELKLESLFTMVHETPTPDMAVKVGDVWKTETVNRMVAGQKLIISSTLLGPQKSLGVDTLKVKVEMKIPPTAGALEKDFISVSGTYNVDPQTGRLIHSEYRMTNIPDKTEGGSALLNVEFATDYLISGLTDKSKPGKSEDHPETVPSEANP